MTTTTKPVGVAVIVGFLALTLLLAGGVSYFSDPSPDGLEAALLDGCVEADGELTGSCAAQTEVEHAFGESIFADYGEGPVTGVAGLVGVALTLTIAFALFRALRGRHGRD